MPLILPPPGPPAGFPVLDLSRPLPPALRGAVVAIGNFDGVHRGHKHVVARARETAAARGRAAVALTFEPHPRSWFQPDVPLFRLTDRDAKIRLLAGSGLDAVAVLAFDAALAGMPAAVFTDRIIAGWLGASGVVIGRDFSFGARRGGNVRSLTEDGRRLGFDVHQVEALATAAGPVSSTAVREALAAGRIGEANDLLGHGWFVTAPVIHGEKRGRTLGYPTANLRLDPACGLRHGIYAVRLGLDGRWHDGVASFGRRPTFDNGAPLLEVHVFDFAESLYDRVVDVAFAGHIRDEEKFSSLEALIARMDQDSREARAILAD